MDLRLSGLQQHFHTLYGPRNLFVNGSFEQRALHVSKRIGRIEDAKRKSDRMPGRIARLVSYYMSLIDSFDGHVSLERGMMLKFPPYGCVYCERMPCGCGDVKRPDPSGRYKLFEEQRAWTIGDWQRHLQRVYGHNNEGKFDRAFRRLTSEFAELCSLMAHAPDTPITPVRILHECELEAADFFSWILTIGYIEGVDIESAIAERYQTCPGCNLIPCDCPLVYISADGLHFSTVGVPGKYGPPNPDSRESKACS